MSGELQTALKIHSAFVAIRERAYRINDAEIIRICNDTIDAAYFLAREVERENIPYQRGLPMLKPITTVLAPAPTEAID